MQWWNALWNAVVECFMECSGGMLYGMHPTTQFADRKGLGTCDALLSLSHTLQSALESGQEARIRRLISISVQPLMESTIFAFSISSDLWVLEVLSSNQECRRAVFLAR